MSVATTPTEMTDVRAARAAARHRRAGLRSAWPYYAAVMLICATAALGLLWSRGWLPGIFAPCRIVVRGCELTSASQIVSSMECDGRQAIPALWSRARAVRKGENRWLRGIGVQSDWGLTAVITVTERRPLLMVVAGGLKYWLCDDQQLVARMAEDRGAAFTSIAAFPRVSLPDDPGEGKLAKAQEYLQLVAACDRYLPGSIRNIEVNRDGEVSLYEPSGFQIKLGRADNMLERIAALPQVLRVCEGHKDKLRFLYASEVNGTLVFYEKWKGSTARLRDGE
ncbi:MAG: cell division protein FtsQ/DivIB [bacterium]|nr:cell division protein FtsQ/DivIB [bacterium]